VTALGQLEVARWAVMEETRAKTAQGLPILSLTLQGGGTTVDTMGNCYVDSCEQVQTRLDKKLTPKTLEANNLRRVMIIGGWSVRQDWEGSYRNWNIIPGCIISEGPEEAEELRSELTKGVGSKRSKGQAFVSEYSESLFYLRVAPICATKYAKMSGYEPWHRRLGHCPNECIRKSIPHSIGMDDLKSARFNNHEKCPACMMGKSRLNNLPKEKVRAKKPLNRVNMDLVSSSVFSLEGHKYALVITDYCTGYRWLYGLKTKYEMLKVVQKWYSDIAELREKHTIYVVMRDNSGENKSQKICDFFESKGIQNYYSTPF
jgi:hypothetical protein